MADADASGLDFSLATASNAARSRGDYTASGGADQTGFEARLRPGHVMVMDNLAPHTMARVVTAMEAAGAAAWYLPRYSPGLNPIEKM